MAMDHLNLVVQDLAQSRHFYETVLGMEVTFEKHLTGPWFEKVTGIREAEADCIFLEFPGGGCRLELLRFSSVSDSISPPLPPSHPGYRHFAFETDDLQGLQERLKQASCPVISDPVTVPFKVGSAKKAKVLFYFRDPDGNIIEAASYA